VSGTTGSWHGLARIGWRNTTRVTVGSVGTVVLKVELHKLKINQAESSAVH